MCRCLHIILGFLFQFNWEFFFTIRKVRCILFTKQTHTQTQTLEKYVSKNFSHKCSLTQNILTRIPIQYLAKDKMIKQGCYEKEN